MMLFKRYTNLI